MSKHLLHKIFNISAFTLFISSSGALSAQSIENPDTLQAGSQQWAYPVPTYGIPELSDTPEGYKPFHMEHYGRHGSRWLINRNDYVKAVEYLSKADSLDKLTPRGKSLLDELKQMEVDSRGRLGELTPLGHRQHRGIASRMIANFPELFTDSTYIDAKSTQIIRCILSMANAVAEIQRQIPGIHVNMDASETTQHILAYNPHDSVALRLINDARPVEKAYVATLPKPSAFFGKVFNDVAFVNDSLDAQDVFDRVFYLAVNTQSHDDYPYFYDLFTPEEIRNAWLERNAYWYITAGDTPITKNRVPYKQRVLLRNIIESADTAMVSAGKSANLRFGHESILLPLGVLMELNNAAYQTDDLNTLSDNWKAYEFFPMASNIQVVFYRRDLTGTNPTPDDVLVKVLLNEKEATLPIEPYQGNYYRWTDLRKFWNDKLENFNVLFEE